MFIIDIIDACSRVYHMYNIRENLKLGFVVKVVASLRGYATQLSDWETLQAVGTTAHSSSWDHVEALSAKISASTGVIGKALSIVFISSYLSGRAAMKVEGVA